MKTSIKESIKRDDEHFLEKHAHFLTVGKENRKIKVLLLGDSLTRRWEDYPDIFSQYFDKDLTANFGVGADCIENLRWRIQNGELEGVNPSLTILLIGTNNLEKNSDEEISCEIIKITELVQEKLPDSRLLLLGLLPRDPDEEGNPFNPRIRTINQSLSEKAMKLSLSYKDFGDTFILKGNDNKVDRDLMPDGLHMAEKGYHEFGKLIRPVVESLI